MRPVNLPVFFKFFLFTLVRGRAESQNLESGMIGGRPMCVRGAGNGEWH